LGRPLGGSRKLISDVTWTVILLSVRNGGDFPEGSETVTIALDAEHKVSIQLGISAGVLETN
jgi:hypothetical protein